MAILGAAMKIADETLPLFAGKQVRIFAHSGRDGQEAGERWSEQLKESGVDATGYSFDGLTLGDNPVSDLNDFVRSLPESPSPEESAQMNELICEAFNFTD